MQKIIFFVICVFFLGCTDPMECSESNRYVGINVISTDNIDSIHFFINKRKICSASQVMMLCKESSKTNEMYAVDGDEEKNRCVGEDYLEWRVYHCYVGEIFGVDDVDSSALGIDLFTSANKISINFPQFVMGGLYINVISVGDTAKWFGYDENPVKPYFDDFKAPSLSTRKGCSDGFCLATIPMPQRDVCHDK